MSIKSYEPDINVAKSYYFTYKSGFRKYLNPNKNMFNEYSPAYIKTNEPLRKITGATASFAKDVLTTAASGDHPIFYKLNAAENIDTFDVSFCAKAIMDIKVAALQNDLSLDQYTYLLSRLYKTNDIKSIPYMADIITKLPNDTKQFVTAMNDYNIFGSGNNISDSNKHTLPTEQEFELMKKSITKPFNFIWSDIMSLHTHLTKQYDVINLSNIPEYLTAESILQLLTDLKNNLKINGYFVSDAPSFAEDNTRSKMIKILPEINSWAIARMPKEILFVQKIR